MIQDFVADPNLSWWQIRPNSKGQLQDFFLQRVQTLLQDELSISYDLVNAVLGEGDPDYAERALVNLSWNVRDRAPILAVICRQNGRLAEVYETVNRAARLASQGEL